MKKRISLAIIVILVLQMILGSAVSEAVCDGCGQTSGELHEYISGESTLYLCDACLLIAQPSAAAETEVPNNIEETPIAEEETPVEEAPVEEETPVEETPSEEETPVEDSATISRRNSCGGAGCFRGCSGNQRVRHGVRSFRRRQRDPFCGGFDEF